MYVRGLFCWPYNLIAFVADTIPKFSGCNMNTKTGTGKGLTLISSTSLAHHGSGASSEIQDLSDSPRDFLYRSGILSLISNSLNLLIQNRPKDPISFLVDYFGNLVEQNSTIQEAYKRITWTDYSKSVFHKNCFEAYQLFKVKKGKSMVKGLKGNVFNDLLLLLTEEFKPKVQQSILELASCPNKQSVTFPAFHKRVLAVFVYKDYMELCESLYQDVDLAGRGKADMCLCNLLLEQIKGLCLSREHVSKKEQDSFFGTEGDKFEKDLRKILQEDEFARSKLTMTSEDFLDYCHWYFLQMVKL